MAEGKLIEGSCFCGAIRIALTGNPKAMGYCHCASCREWSGGPVNAFTLWAPEALRVTEGVGLLKSYNKTPRSYRKWCSQCGGHVLGEHPQWGLIDVFAAIIPDLDFEPALHVNYAETVLPVRDGLPKLKDFPAEMGGSGETIPE
ncbi:MAG TPA: GFA family protein [Gammaproteobacteria bacterium]|nr:GFA family protein [Gammaproteobacteria bacterium]